MHKSNFIKPSLSDLEVGNIVPIYLDYQNNNKLMGYAMILKRFPLENNSYVRKEIGSNIKRDPNCVVWKFDRFKVKYVDPIEYNPNISRDERYKYIHQKDFVTIVKISYFYTISSVINENI